MTHSIEDRPLVTTLAAELLGDDRVLAPNERNLLFNLLDDARGASTGNAELDDAVSHRLISAAVGSMSSRIVGALADELVRQLLSGHGTGQWPDPRRAPQVSPSNPGNSGGQVSPTNPGNRAPQVSPSNPGNGPGIQVSPSNPGNRAPQVSPSNPGNNPGSQVSPSNPGNRAPQVSPSNPGNGPGIQVSPSNPGNSMMPQVSPSNPGNGPGIQVSPSNPGNYRAPVDDARAFSPPAGPGDGGQPPAPPGGRTQAVGADGQEATDPAAQAVPGAKSPRKR